MADLTSVQRNGARVAERSVLDLREGDGVEIRATDDRRSDRVTAEFSADYALLDEYTVTSAESPITFTRINQDYRHLRVTLASSPTTGTVTYHMQLNNDTGTTYHYQLDRAASTTASATAQNGQTSVTLGGATNFEASRLTQFDIHIFNYTAAFDKQGYVVHPRFDSGSSAAFILDHTGFMWNSTAAITEIDLIPNTTTHIVGSHAQLYGIR